MPCQPYVMSKRHKGRIVMMVTYSRGGGVGRKICADGALADREVCLFPGDIVAERPLLPGCEDVALRRRA
ncbi:hypothetical protein G3N56_19520 [Desulfovibrio sulfodismutans]|uniref:Uncharacterized protein n=1 Tax=Desulfolutivibrio sulfodismutans TaxID=63561 RepID=A0A7K3NS03_9BACT|nr:hypothetical protein [Desulfolutivibrio sulfodismutans]NDY58931.1 hypothetical protein [Desulfolutivibrio sulfodismutans]QLA13564.1 hypothetical protein GD606_15465 [Desulfolutivibrio sulfodismutans DSM 3696]